MAKAELFRITNISVGSNILHEWCYSGLKTTCMRVNPALQAAHALFKTVCIVRLPITAQKLVLISCRVARTYVSVSDRRVSRRFLMRLTIGLILTCAWRLGTVTCQNSQKGVGVRIVYSKQCNSSSNFKAFFETKNALREFLQGRSLLVYLPTGFPASSNRCRCSAAYSAI